MRFSIIIPAHNSEEYIFKALESIRAQSYKDYELIVVCDSCTDDTKAVAEFYGARTDVVEYHCDGPTRNRGIELARGDYILFMDDDDWWLHEFVFQQLSDKIDDYTDVDVFCFAFIFRHIGYAKPIRNHNGMHWPACWNKCYKRTSIGSSRFSNDTDGSADMQFYSDMMSKGLYILDWNMPLYYYNYWRDDSISERRTYDFRGRTDLL